MIIRFEDLESIELTTTHPFSGFTLGFIDDYPAANTEISLKLNFKDDSQLNLNCIVTSSVHRSPKLDMSDLLKNLGKEDIVCGKSDSSELIGKPIDGLKFLGDK